LSFAGGGAEDLSEALSDAVECIGLHRSSFSVNLQPQGGEHLVVAAMDSGLVARLRPAGEVDADSVSRNLRAISAAADGGAPVLAPAWPEPVRVRHQRGEWVATLWPLARNRLVTVDEMAEVLRRLHDTRPPAGLGEWLEVCFGRVRQDAEALRTVDPAPPQDVVDSCTSLADKMMSRLEALVRQSPRVLVHGDSHAANILELDGRVAACDFDRVSIGPPEADLVIPLSHSRTYPGADPAAGENLVRAYGRPVNRELLAAAVDVRGISKTVGLARTWGEPLARESLSQRLHACRTGARFARLHGTERLCPFAI